MNAFILNKKQKEISLQYRGFARGHPPHYWPGSTELDFPERTRGGTFIRDMTEDTNTRNNYQYKSITTYLQIIFDLISFIHDAIEI